MANVTKQKRDKMLSFIEELKKNNNDDKAIMMLNELENTLSEKKFGLVFEEHTEEVDEKLKENIPILCSDENKRICKDKQKPWNFIIEGDNLQALYLLEKTHRGKIDCIYIDPPYNTGARDWKYNNDYVDNNDLYRHSKWLSMMKTRLEIAKKLLNPRSSVLICTIDDKEYLHLGCVLEELFPLAKITMVSSVINPAGKAKKGGVDFSRIDEYIFFIQIGDAPVLPEVRDIVKTPLAWETFRRHSLANGRGKHGVGACGPNQFYPIYVDNKTHKIVEIGEPIMEDIDRFSVKQIPGCSTVFPVRDNGIEMNWGATREEALKRLKNGYLKVGKYFPDAPQQYSIQYLTGGVIKDIQSGKVIVEGYDDNGGVIGYYTEGRAKVPTTAWNKKSHNATSYGTDLLNKIFGDAKFDYPKSLYAVKDCLGIFLANKPNALVLDFFAGSGTTLHAVNLMNAEDGGNRTSIMVTNNEISYLEENRLKEKGYKKGDPEWEKLGIAQSVTWPRTKCSIEGVDVKNHPLDGDYGVEIEDYQLDEESAVVSKTSGKKLNTKVYKKTKIQLYPNLSNIKLKDGFVSNVKYFKCDWTPRKPEEYLLSNVLLLHIKEMIELENSIEVDNSSNVIIFNKDDYDKYILDEENYKKIKNIWVNQNIIFDSNEISLLKNKNFKYIPKEYFGQELKEVAE